MILLDTNVLSEVMRPEPDAGVAAWMRKQPPQTLWTSTVVEAEILFGICALGAGRRRDALALMARAIFEEFEGRVLPFDRGAAGHYARIVSDRRSRGRPIEGFDGLIAATAAAAGARLATRDVRDFEGCGLTLIDPWRRA